MKKLLFLILLFGPVSYDSFGQSAVKQANRFIELLTEEQKLSTLFPFDNNERYNFHFVPIKRKGVTFNEMSAEQIEVGLGLLKICLSDQTYKKTNDIVKLEVILKELEKESRRINTAIRAITILLFLEYLLKRISGVGDLKAITYHLIFFDQKLLVSGTPGFLGTNPAIVPSGPAVGTQILKEEADLGFELLHSLNKVQFKQAMIDSVAYPDILTFDKEVRSSAIPKELNIAI